jgi:hypothetical protein
MGAALRRWRTAIRLEQDKLPDVYDLFLVL